MPNENETLNEESESSTDEETLNETSDSSTLKESADLVSTTEYEDADPSEEKSNTEDEEKTQEETEDEIEEKGEKKTSDHVPYDRFQEVVTNSNNLKSENVELRERIARLEGRIESGGKKEDEQQVPYKNIAQMSADEIREWFDEDPLKFSANLASQIQHETLSAVEQFLSTKETEAQKKAQETGVKTTLERYVENNPDFNEMKKEIQDYINNNPGHTQISAHMALTQEKRINDAVAKAVKDTEARKDQEHKLKKKAKALPAGARVSGGEREPIDLKDTKKHGGLTAVLSRRLAAMRNAT